MSIEAWAHQACQDRWRQDSEHQRAIDTIQSVLEDKTASNDAASTIAALYEPLIKRGTLCVPTLWGIFCDAARVLGGKQENSERLVDLLNSISGLPDVKTAEGNPMTPAWSSAGVYWRDLPEFTMIFREYGIDIQPEDALEAGEKWDDQALPLLNATTFGAINFLRGKNALGMPFHIEISLMHGIETHYLRPDQWRRASMYVPPAATWIIFAGRKIHELCASDFDRQNGAKGFTPEGEECLWGRGRGYSLERWAFWKRRFGEIAATKGLEDRVRGISARAERGMVEVDEGVGG